MPFFALKFKISKQALKRRSEDRQTMSTTVSGVNKMVDFSTLCAPLSTMWHGSFSWETTHTPTHPRKGAPTDQTNNCTKTQLDKPKSFYWYSLPESMGVGFLIKARVMQKQLHHQMFIVHSPSPS